MCLCGLILHDDVIKWKHFPRYCPFVRRIHRSPVNSPHKGRWRGALMFSLIYAWINDWVNNREAGDLRHQRGHYDVIVMNRDFWHSTTPRDLYGTIAAASNSINTPCLSVPLSISLSITLLLKLSIKSDEIYKRNLPCERTWSELPGIWDADVTWPPSELIIFWSRSFEFFLFWRNFDLMRQAEFGFPCILRRMYKRNGAC